MIFFHPGHTVGGGGCEVCRGCVKGVKGVKNFRGVKGLIKRTPGKEDSCEVDDLDVMVSFSTSPLVKQLIDELVHHLRHGVVVHDKQCGLSLIIIYTIMKS